MNFASFSKKLPVLAGCACVAMGVSTYAAAANELTVEQAARIVAPFYDALNQPSTKNVDALMHQATSAEWVSCGGNTVCMPRDAIIAAFKARGNAIPDLKWAIVDVIVAGNQVIVRGEATGTPVASVNGAPVTGKSFRVMSIDVHTIENQKMVRSYHVEDWAGAARQLSMP